MAADKRTLEILIAMGMKPDAVNKTIAEFKKINQQIDILEKDAKNLKEAIEVALAHGEDTSELKSQLKVAEDGMSRLQSQTERTNNSAKDLRENAYYFRDIGEKLNQIGMGMQNAGNALLSPLQGAMAAYMEQQQAIKEAGGQMSASAKAYLDAQKQMQSAYVRIGAIATDKLLPIVETAADLLNKFASFIEQNPELVTAIAGMGVTLLAGGKIVSALGSISMFLGTLQGLGVVGGGAAVAEGGGLLAGAIPALTAAAPAIGVLIGGAILAELERKGLNKLLGTNQSFGDIANTGQKLGAMTDITGGPLTAISLALKGLGFDEAAAKVWGFNKDIHGLGDAAKEAAPPTQKTAEELQAAAAAAQKAAAANKQFTDALQQYQLESQRAEEDYYHAREEIQRDGQAAELDLQRSHYASMAQLASQYDSQVADINANYADQQQQAQQQYEQQRAQAVADAQQAEAQARADHLEALRKLEEEHNDNVWKITQDRDALALTQENDRYGKAVNDENSSFQKERAQRRAELQATLADMAAAYQQQKQQAAQQHAQDLADAKKEYEEKKKEEEQQYRLEQEKLKQQQTEKLRQLDYEYQLERQRRQQNFAMQIQDLDTSLLNETNRKRQWYEIQASQLDEIIKQAQSKVDGMASTGTSAPLTPHALGGYADYGHYLLGEQGREFVTTAGTTAQLEKIAGGSLTQDKLLAMAAGGNVSVKSAPQINLTQEITFNGDISASNKASFRSFMREVSLETLNQVMAV